MKYNNKKNICKFGHKHDSLREAARCIELSLLQKASMIKGYRAQVTYDLKVNDILICRHIVDFEIIDKAGNKYVEDVKGVKTAAWSIKYKLFKALYPGIKYIIIK